MQLNSATEEQCLLVLKQDVNNAEALNYLGLFAYNKRDFALAVQYYEKAIQQKPHESLYYYNLALAYAAFDDLAKAIDALQQALKYSPQNINILLTLASVYVKIAEYHKAKSILKLILKKHPKHEKAQELLAICYNAIGDINNASIIYKKIIEENPNNETALINFAKISAEEGNLSYAFKLLNHALAINNSNANAWNNLGNCHILNNDYNNAVAALLQACSLDANILAAKVNLGLSYVMLGQYTRALEVLECLDNAELSQANQYLYQKVLVQLALLYTSSCDFAQARKYCDRLSKININPQDLIILPFQAIMLGLNLPLINKITDYYSKNLSRQVKINKLNIKKNNLNQKILRIGYLSADFCKHAVGLLLYDFLKYHTNNIEAHVLSLKEHNDEINAVIKASTKYYHNYAALSDIDASAAINALKLDLVIDLSAYTQFARPKVLFGIETLKAHWLGYSFALGKRAVDYYFADPILVPQGEQQLFSEKIVYLPRLIARTPFTKTKASLTRADYDLDQDAFIFCSFAKHYRFDEALYDTWLEILSSVPNSILWLQSGGEVTDRNLLQYAANKINPNRIKFNNNNLLTTTWHHTLADLWLDPWKLSSGTSTIICIAGGLPFVTLNGDTPMGRVGASIAHAANLSELCVTDKASYKKLAIELASNKNYYNLIKSQVNIAQNSALFQPELFMQEFEQILFKI